MARPWVGAIRAVSGHDTGPAVGTFRPAHGHLSGQHSARGAEPSPASAYTVDRPLPLWLTEIRPFASSSAMARWAVVLGSPARAPTARAPTGAPGRQLTQSAIAA